MIDSISKAFRIKELRRKIGFTFLMIILVRLGSQIPVPGIDVSYFREWFANNGNDAFNLFSAFTGGSFERFSVFGLGVTPYITASIIIQLLTIAIPALEELRKDGNYGKKKLDWINRWTALGLAGLESAAMAIGFGRSGLLPGMTVLRGIIVVICLTGGTALMIFMGWLIDKKGIGNGISIILMVNILAGIPRDFATMYEMFVKPQTPAKAVLAAAVIIAVSVLTVVLVVLLNEAVRRIPIQNSRKVSGRSLISGQKSYLPIKVNISNVMPIIFASSLLSIPQLIASIAGKRPSDGVLGFFLAATNQSNWFDPARPQYSVGLILYLALVFFFAFFYASIAFNPMEIADNLKKSGATIPGIRQGKPTEEFLKKTTDRLVVIGSTGLIAVMLIPLFFSGAFNAGISFGGTSLIIIVGVILETLSQIEAGMQAHNYRGFLAD